MLGAQSWLRSCRRVQISIRMSLWAGMHLHVCVHIVRTQNGHPLL
jgi:hypothetical protein